MTLWNPISVGVIELPHRLAMHLMTRVIARGRTTCPGPHREYYRQRRLMELTSTEGTVVAASSVIKQPAPPRG